jgi:hypothetical protein
MPVPPVAALRLLVDVPLLQRISVFMMSDKSSFVGL